MTARVLQPLRRRIGPRVGPHLERGLRARDEALAPLLRRRGRTFALDGQAIPYYVHPFNETWRNERAVEIALAQRALARHGHGRVLEVGNVLHNYSPHQHVVVDKYERDPRVLNLDVMEYEPSEPVDLVLCISTLEHIGFEEEIDEPDKPARALARLAGFLAPEGRLLVTFPLGYNPGLDRAVRAGELPLTELRVLRKVSRNNRWEQVALEGTEDAAYNRPYRKANVLAVGSIGDPAR